VDFSFGGSTLRVDSLSGNIAEGGIKLGAFAVDLSAPNRINGVANLNAISLAPLVAASNLGSKIKLIGKVTGTVPFAAGPDGFRIANGHLQSDGPGRISLNRSVWSANGEPAANAVQDLAYQALENLAFDQMTADINSVAGGRLQVLFHIKGHSDPPKPQQAEVAVADIINGSALQKPIALPSATPIDLTLDTSLNFDELLKSYAEAWSKTLSSTSDP
jgi:Dicarboxylate transport